MQLDSIIQDCIRGKATAQRKFYDQYAPMVMGICMRYASNKDQAADMLQEVFIKIFKNLDQLKDPRLLISWMKSITVRVALDQLKQDKFPAEKGVSGYDAEGDQYEKIIDRLSNELLIALINELPDGYRAVFNMYVIDGYSHEEIALQLGISQSTSRSQLTYARRSLQEKLKVIGITSYESVF